MAGIDKTVGGRDEWRVTGGGAGKTRGQNHVWQNDEEVAGNE